MIGNDEFEKLGGIEILRSVSKAFYDKVYAHPWIGQYFKDVDQKVIESQQVDFMAQVLGGPQKYCGKFVPEAHAHMLITEELFVLREKLLLDAMTECDCPVELRDRWLKVDRAFKAKVVKKSEAECTLRFVTDKVMSFTKPSGMSNS